jgi:pimeloyl-ACP methyl ester carboxylesterase
MFRRQTKLFHTDDGVRMYFQIKGTNSKALVFLSGFLFDSRSWPDQIDFFKNKYKVIAMDLPGFGKSGINRNKWSM